MRQIWISKAGPPEALVVKEAPDPQPAAGETRIRVEARAFTVGPMLFEHGGFPTTRRRISPAAGELLGD